MKFYVYGGFEIERRENRHGLFNRDFWKQVEETEPGLSDACGCYLFAMKNGDNVMPWYVGKTDRTFYNECFAASKINLYNELLVEKNGAPLLFLLPKLTSTKRIFAKPTSGGSRAIAFLENMLIGMRGTAIC